MNVDLIRGTGRITGERTVHVVENGGDSYEMTANKAVVVATGSYPAMLPVPRLAGAKPWGSPDATSAKGAPELLLILGGVSLGLRWLPHESHSARKR